MTIQELKETDWYKSRPLIIKRAIDIAPPIYTYKFKDTNKQCEILSYEEPDNIIEGKVTLTVQKIGKGGVLCKMGLACLDRNQVFGVEIDDIIKI